MTWTKLVYPENYSSCFVPTAAKEVCIIKLKMEYGVAPIEQVEHDYVYINDNKPSIYSHAPYLNFANDLAPVRICLDKFEYAVEACKTVARNEKMTAFKTEESVYLVPTEWYDEFNSFLQAPEMLESVEAARKAYEAQVLKNPFVNLPETPEA